MNVAETIFTHSVLILVLSGLSFSFLLTGYGALRALHISVNWIAWIVGSLILATSAAMCLIIALIHVFPAQMKSSGNTIGGLAFVVAICSVSQWTMRQWYLRIKKDASRRVKQFSKDVLMFLRKHHVFFGLIVGLGSIAHMVFFFPILERYSLYEEVTGFIAIGILALIALLGAWLWVISLRKRPVPKPVQTIHTVLSIAFFLALFLHL